MKFKVGDHVYINGSIFAGKIGVVVRPHSEVTISPAYTPVQVEGVRYHKDHNGDHSHYLYNEYLVLATKLHKALL
jgi:ribosomal protein L24